MQESNEWLSQATDKFVELAGTDKELTALVSSSNVEKDGAISLLLFKDDIEDEYSVNELLVFLRCASSNVFQEIAGIILIDIKISNSFEIIAFLNIHVLEESVIADDETEWGDPMADDYFSPMNNSAYNTENYDSVTTGYIPKDENRICRFYAATGSCFKGGKNVNSKSFICIIFSCS